MAEGLTAIIVVNIPAEPGVGQFEDCHTLADCATVQTSMFELGIIDLAEFVNNSPEVRAYAHPAHDLDPTLSFDCCDHVRYSPDARVVQCQKCGRAIDDAGAAHVAPVLRLVANR